MTEINLRQGLEHGMQFNSYVNKGGTSALFLIVGVAAAPFGALASLSTLAGGLAPSLVRALRIRGVPSSVWPWLASKAIHASGVLNGPKTIFVSSDGRVISNMFLKR